jgi:hypothetical protein
METPFRFGEYCMQYIGIQSEDETHTKTGSEHSACPREYRNL